MNPHDSARTSVVIAHYRPGHTYEKLPTVPMGTDDLAVPRAAVKDNRVNCLALLRRNYSACDCLVKLTESLRRGPSEESLRRSIAVGHTEIVVHGHNPVVDLIQKTGLKFERVAVPRFLEQATQGLSQTIDRSLIERAGQCIGGAQEGFDRKTV